MTNFILTETPLIQQDFDEFRCRASRGLTPDFSTTGRLVKSDFQGEIGHEEVEIH
jgi:hypothetical protein